MTDGNDIPFLENHLRMVSSVQGNKPPRSGFLPDEFLEIPDCFFARLSQGLRLNLGRNLSRGFRNPGTDGNSGLKCRVYRMSGLGSRGRLGNRALNNCPAVGTKNRIFREGIMAFRTLPGSVCRGNKFA